MSVTSADSDLAQRFRDGDSAALAELVRRHTPRLRAILSRRGCPHQEREDIVQRTWLRVCDARTRFDPLRPFGPWVAQIATRLWIDDLRRSKTRRSAGEVDGGDDAAGAAPSPAADADQPDRFERQEVLLAIAALPTAQREAILLTQYEGLSMREAAAVSGTGVSGVKSRVSRGYAAMRGFIEDPSSRPALPARRLIQLEVAGCERCEAVLSLVRSVSCPSCDVEIREVSGDGPRLFVDGKAVDGLSGALSYDGTLRALGVGLCATPDPDDA